MQVAHATRRTETGTDKQYVVVQRAPAMVSRCSFVLRSSCTKRPFAQLARPRSLAYTVSLMDKQSYYTRRPATRQACMDTHPY